MVKLSYVISEGEKKPLTWLIYELKNKMSVTSLCIKSFKVIVIQKKWLRSLKVLKSVIEMKILYMLEIIFQQV